MSRRASAPRSHFPGEPEARSGIIRHNFQMVQRFSGPSATPPRTLTRSTDVDQLHRDVLELIRYSLSHPPGAAGFFFPMFRQEQIESLYAIPRDVRERIWKNRGDPEYQALFPRDAGEQP